MPAEESPSTLNALRKALSAELFGGGIAGCVVLLDVDDVGESIKDAVPEERNHVTDSFIVSDMPSTESDVVLERSPLSVSLTVSVMV